MNLNLKTDLAQINTSIKLSCGEVLESFLQVDVQLLQICGLFDFGYRQLGYPMSADALQ